MRFLFTDHLDKKIIDSAIENTVKLSNKVEEYKILGTYKMPNFPIPDGYQPIEYLKEITIKGLLEILDIGVLSGNSNGPSPCNIHSRST